MFKKNISQQEMLIAVVIYLISVPFVFQLLEKQYISFGLVKGGVEGFDGKITDKIYIGSRLHSNPSQTQADISSGIIPGPRRQINFTIKYSL